MKKLKILAALATMMLLCSCAQQKGQATSQEQPQEQQKMEASSVLRLISNATDKKCIGADGIYDFYQDAKGDVFLTFLPFGGEAQEIICNKAGCVHHDNSCDAWLYNLGSGFVRTKLFSDGSDVYFVVYDSSGENRIETIEPTTHMRTVVCALPDGTVPTGEFLCGDAENLYWLQMDSDGTWWWNSLRLSNGNASRFDFPPEYTGNFVFLIDVVENQPVFLWIAEAQSVDFPAAEEGKWTQEQLNAFNAAIEENESLRQNEIFTLNLSMENFQSLAKFTQDTYESRIIANGTLYGVPTGSGRVEATTLATGERKILVPQLPATKGSYLLECICDGKLLVTALHAPGDYQYDEMERYGIDLTNGSLVQAPLIYSHFGGAWPVWIGAESSTQFLVLEEERAVQKTIIGSDGVPDTIDSIDQIFAWIDKEDYWQGNSNYQPCTMLS